MMEEIKQHALTYLDRCSIIPIESKGKRPLINWKEFQERKPTKEEVEEWFKKYPDANIAIVTGKISDFAVVDIEKGGSTESLPTTIIARTGGGGWHYYYKYEEGIENKARVKDLIDIRGEGGYCFTAGHRVCVRPKNKYYKHSKSVKIEDIREGDEVLSFNEKTGNIEPKKVIKTGNRVVEKTIFLKFGSRQGSLRCSEEHPIYTTNGWVEATNIKEGDELLTFTREQLLFGKLGHTFPKGVQSGPKHCSKDYKYKYTQVRPPNIKHKSKYEKFVESLIEQENLPIDYCGDGSLVLKNGQILLIPDFVVRGKKKVIEIHCDFHNRNRRGMSGLERRKKEYEKIGWKCLAIDATKWKIDECLLDLIYKLKKDLIEFCGNGKKVVFNHQVYEKVRVYNIEVEGNHNYFIVSPNENKQTWYLVHNCVAPPSYHSSGNRYTWVNQNNGIAAPFPKHLFGVRENKWEDVAEGTSEGERNETASRYIGKLMSVFSPDTWESTVWETVRAWNEKNTPPLPENELRQVYESIKRRAIKNPRSETVRENVNWITMTELVERGKQELLNTKPEDIVSFGYDWLDEKLTGLFPGELVIFGGETGSGKTTFTTNVIYKASKKRKCAVFALEDRLNNYSIKRLYFEVGKIRRNKGKKNYPWNIFRKNEATNQGEFLEEIDEAEENLKNGNIFFVDIERQIDIELLEELIQEQVDNGVELFLIDHLHYFDLLKGHSSKADYIEHLMVRLKTLQNKTGARIIMVVHYKKLEGAKPRLDSFKDSISIVQNADYVVNIYRDRESEDADNNKTTFYIPKSRNPNGEGWVCVNFDPEVNDYTDPGGWYLGGPDKNKEINKNEVQQMSTNF